MTNHVSCDTIVSEGVISSAEKMDAKFNAVCEETGLIKSKVLELIGESIQTYANKRKRNGLNQESIKMLSCKLHDIANSIRDIVSNSSQYKNHSELIEALHEQTFIKKQQLIKLVGGHTTFLQDRFKRTKFLQHSELEMLKKGLLEIAKKLENTSI